MPALSLVDDLEYEECPYSIASNFLYIYDVIVLIFAGIRILTPKNRVASTQDRLPY